MATPDPGPDPSGPPGDPSAAQPPPGAGGPPPASPYFKVLCGIIAAYFFVTWFVSPFIDYLKEKLKSKEEAVGNIEDLRKKRGTL